MKKIGFVCPWFGWDIPGGAEAALRGIVTHLHESGMELEVLTTCVKEFGTDWTKNYHKPGTVVERGIVIRRFRANTKRDTAAFIEVNEKLMHNEMPLTAEEERAYVDNIVNSDSLYAYIRENKQDYGLFVFIPYMFGTTYYGVQQCMEKAVVIPCFHDESYIYMEVFKKAYSGVRGMISLAKPEAELAARVYDLSSVRHEVLGIGVDTDHTYDANRFRKKYGIESPFILYAGRKDNGKNIYSLIYQFEEYKTTHHNDLKLVLIGGGKVDIPHMINNDVYDLGYVNLQDKFDAYAAATMLCQPSKNESFSIVIMESWICGRPVLVHDHCAVTKNFVRESNGGLYFKNYYEFEREVDYLLDHPEQADEMGRSGRKYVLENFAWDVIVRKYTDFFQKLAD